MARPMLSRDVPPTSYPRVRSWLRLAGVLLLGGFATAVVLEVLLRLGARGLSPGALGAWDERRPWEAIRSQGPDGPRPVPGGHAAWRIQPWHQPIEYQLDRNGFRTVDGPMAARGGSAATALTPCRVLALGDSHTFGYGVGAVDAWPAVLESTLVRVTVANGGLCGSGIVASEAWLPDALAAANPHVVVLAMTPWSLREDPEAPEQHELDARWPRADVYFRRASRYSAVVDRLSRAVLQRSASWLGWPPPAPMLWELNPLLESRTRFHERWRTVHARLAHMIQLVRRRGGMPIVMFIPLDIQVSAARNVLYRTGGLPYRTHGFVDRDYTQDDRYSRALDKTATRLHVVLIDATPMLRALGPVAFLSDSYHLSSEGHAHLAALISGSVVTACTEAPSMVEAAIPPPPIRRIGS